MAFLDTLGAEIKATFKRIPFSSVGGQGYNASNQVTGWNGIMLGNRQPGATLNYDELAGDPLDNRVVAACIEAISSALPEAPPILEKRKGDDWERIPDHPVLDLLHHPNNYHTPFHLWNATIGSELTAGDGSAYWQVVMNEAGMPAELWFEPRVKVLWNAKEFISGYQLERDGKWVNVKNDQIIHFRNSLNPYNTRLGRNALAAGKRQITGDNAAATYHSALLRNSAVASLLVTLKDGGTTTLTPEQLNEYMERLTNKLRGEGAGKIAGSNLPIDVHKLAYSPDEMAIDKLIAYYEVSICALLKVPAMVIGLGGGADGKTYSNYGEAIRDFWMRTIIPAQNRRGMEITTQLLPLFGLDASQHRLSFDYANVAALTEDDNPLMDVLVKVCGGAFMTKNEARSRLKMEPLPEGGDEIAAPPPVAPPAPDASQAPPKVETKSYNPRQPRDDHGKWSDGAGGISQGHAAHVMKFEGISDKDAAGVLSKIKDGTHKTREDVLKHIDSIHVMGKAPKRGGAYVGGAPFHSWNRVGGKGLAGSFYASDADVEGHGGVAGAGGIAWRESQPVFSRMRFAADDKVLHVDATANPSGSGEYAFAHLATARDHADLDKLLRDHPNDHGLDLFFMDAVGALRAKEKGLAGIVSYDSGKIGDAVDLRSHSVEELQSFARKLLVSGTKSFDDGAKSWEESQHPRAENGEFGTGGSATSKQSKSDLKKNTEKSANFKAWFGDWEHDPANASKVVDTSSEPQETMPEMNTKPVYHGTSAAFDAFDKSKMKPSLYGPGFYFTENPDVAGSYQDKENGENHHVIPCYLNIRNPFPVAPLETEDYKKGLQNYRGVYEPRTYGMLTKDQTQSMRKAFTENRETFAASLKSLKLTPSKVKNKMEFLDALTSDKANSTNVKSEDYLDSIYGCIGKDEGNRLLQLAGFDGITHIGGGRFVHGSVKHRVWIAFEPHQIKAVDNAGTFDPNSDSIYKSLDTSLMDTNEPKADELPAWTPEELDEMSEEFSEDDIKRALATSDEPLRELLKAKDAA